MIIGNITVTAAVIIGIKLNRDRRIEPPHPKSATQNPCGSIARRIILECECNTISARGILGAQINGELHRKWRKQTDTVIRPCGTSLVTQVLR